MRIPFRSHRIIVAAFVLVLPAGPGSGILNAQEEIAQGLKVGDSAPDFRIPSTLPVPRDGSTVSVSALVEEGQAVVIAFFPKAFTGG